MRETIIEFRNFSFKYALRNKYAIKDFSATICQGECAIFLGTNGSGKSTLCYALMGLIPHFYAGTMEGNVSVMGLNTKKASISSLTRYVAYIPQRIGSALITPHVLTELAFSLEMAGLKRETISRRILKFVEEFRISHLLHRNPQTLSEGEKQLITILSAIIREPEIIIADEPLSNLDQTYREKIKGIFQKLKDEGKTLIIATNEPKYYNNLVDKFYSLGSVVFQHNNAKITFERLIDNFKQLNIVKKSSGTTIHLRDASFKYSSGFQISNISLEISPGDIVAFIGDNGSGKTTLLRLICGLLTSFKGEILYNNKDITKLSWSSIAKRVGFIFQNPDHQLLEQTVKREVCATIDYLYNRKVSDTILTTALSLAGLNQYSSYHPQSLSFGEKRRLTFLSAIFHDPEIILVDEITNGLDDFSKEWVTRLLKHLQHLNKTIILVSHDIDWVKEISTHIYKINNGVIKLFREGSN